MKKRMPICVLLAALLLCPTTHAAEDTACSLTSVTRQDPQNVVLQWEGRTDCAYEIYRASAEDGEYERIGTAPKGSTSYRDDAAQYPNAGFYKVLPIGEDGTRGAPSAPMGTGVNPRPVRSVPVVMYHHFVSPEDEKRGVAFEEYSLRPEAFEADLLWLRSNGYTTITSDDLLAYLNGSKPLPAKPIIITIDDGSKGVFDHAWPLLEKYNMKADLNIICDRIDAAWSTVHEGGSRDGEPDPYCTWSEIRHMVNSGTINLCSHTYGMHYFNRKERIGAKMKDGETLSEYAQAVKDDFALVTSSLTGWTDIVPRTLAYPYSRRSAETDGVMLENTAYEILMAGQSARGTESNYFVEGADRQSALTLMSRVCRMNGTPLERYLDDIHAADYANGVNGPENTRAMTVAHCAEVAANYRIFDDVPADAAYAGSVYYAYVNGLMPSTGYVTFSPGADITRAMAAAILHRMAGEPESRRISGFSDVPAGTWCSQPVAWAAENGILPGLSDGMYRPNGKITREELAMGMYRCAAYLGQDCSLRASLDGFSDAEHIAPQAKDAMGWAVACGLYAGSDGAILPRGNVTRAEMAGMLHIWNLAMDAA